MLDISVVGLGKLGACTAACMAAKGHKVIGVDINKTFVDSINAGKAPVLEPQLQETIDASEGRLTATQDFKEALEKSDITLLIVPTPSIEDGSFTNKFLISALTELGKAYKDMDKYHNFVITSTVNPNACTDVLAPVLEEFSGKKFMQDFDMCYNPEFIALGSVIKDFLNPDMLLIGESSKKAGDQLDEIYRRTCGDKPYYARMSLVSAEITKVSLNSFVTMKISYANTLANICEGMKGANIDDITDALGADKRVSPYYIKGGISFGGPCFPRDNRALAFFASQVGVDAKLALATDDVNEYQVKHLNNKIMSLLEDVSKESVAVLGLAYKPNTPVIEESPAVKLINRLLESDAKVVVHDELATEAVKVIFGDKITYASTKEEAIKQSTVTVVATLDKAYKDINNSHFEGIERAVLVDCWRMLDPAQFGSNVKYVGVGQFTENAPVSTNNTKSDYSDNFVH